MKPGDIMLGMYKFIKPSFRLPCSVFPHNEASAMARMIRLATTHNQASDLHNYACSCEVTVRISMIVTVHVVLFVNHKLYSITHKITCHLV